MNTMKTLLIACALTFSGLLHAQDSTDMKSRAFQLAFFTPLGTNGFDSWNCVNKFSINILGGYAGGINGEFVRYPEF
jgi:hypothetical protein